MDIDSVLATGGVGGATGIIIFFVYKLLKMGLKSKCCGYSVEIGLQTPKNITIIDDKAQSYSESQGSSCNGQRPQGGPGGQDKGRISGEGSGDTQGHCSSSDNFTGTNPLTIVVPKPIQ